MRDSDDMAEVFAVVRRLNAPTHPDKRHSRTVLDVVEQTAPTNDELLTVIRGTVIAGKVLKWLIPIIVVLTAYLQRGDLLELLKALSKVAP